MVGREFQIVLRTIHPVLEAVASPWAITGSLGFALQGVAVAVHDVDIQTDCKGAYEIERRLSAYIVRPVAFSESGRIRSHFGALEMEGIKLEIMGDVQKKLPDGRWEEPVDVTIHRRWLIWEAMRLPVLSLEYEYQAYLILGRMERAEMLKRWIEGRKE